MKNLCLMAVLMGLISACSVEKTYTVEELEKNEKLTEKILEECREMSLNDRSDSTNCARAQRAIEKIDVKRFAGEKIE